MKIKWKHIFRYPLSDIYMVVGLVTAFLALFFSRTITDQNHAREADEKKYEYNESLSIAVVGDAPLDFETLFEDTSGIISISDVSVSLNDYGYTNLATVIVSSAEEMKYQLCEGEYPFTDSQKETLPTVLLGRGLAVASHLRNGQRYIVIQNEEYLVSGIIGTEYSNAQDYELILFWDACGENVKELIRSSLNRTFRVESNRVSGREIVTQIYENIDRYGLESQLLVNDNASYHVYSSSGTDNTLFYLLYVFCMIDCLIISEFWISQRSYDVAIRRIWGYNSRKLFTFLYRQLMKPVCVAAVVCVVLQGFSRYLKFDGISLAIRLTPENVLWLLLEILLSAAVIAFYGLKQVNKNQPIDAIKTC